MARTTLSEQNAALQSTIETLKTQLSSLQQRTDSQQRELDNQAASRWMNEARTKAENELEQAHAVLDSVPGAPARTYEDKSSSYSSEKSRNVVTRLAGAFLAIARGDVKVAQ